MSNNIDGDQDYPLARCHNCGLAMFLIRSENAPPNRDLLTYRCNRCGTQASGSTKFSVKQRAYADRKIGGGSEHGIFREYPPGYGHCEGARPALSKSLRRWLQDRARLASQLKS